MPIQQMLLGAGGAVATKTYVDDIFSTYLHTGTGSAKSINNGIDLAGEGGLVWGKSRSHAHTHVLIDTVRGASNGLLSQSTNAQYAYSPALITSFNNNGYSVAADGSGSINYVESGGNELAAWTFRRAKGFFTIKKFTGNGTNQTLTHDLGCVPGCIMYKNLDSTAHWVVWHRGISDSSDKALALDQSWSEDDDVYFNDTDPTATHFTVGAKTQTNGNGDEIIAYLFAGGESTNALARSVEFDGSNDKVSIPDSTDFEFGSGDFTIEAWIKQTNAAGSNNDSHTIVNKWDNTSNAKEWILRIDNGTGSNKLQWLQTQDGNSNQFTTGNTVIHVGQWYHVAVVGHSGTIKLFVNGIQQASTGTQGTINSYSNPLIFGYNESSNGQWMDGSISNCRIVKGTAVYTSSFKPPTEPLTNITNTKLLCLNNSSVTGSTVSPGTLTNDGATASTDSPFDDPAGFVFGANEDQNVIKCGSYTKTDTGSSNTIHIELGWEPQIILQKRTDGSDDWYLMDVMRQMSTGLTEILRPNSSGAELDYGGTIVVPTATGFTVKDNNSDSYIFLAIRRSDGYVGKPPELGTDVFAMDAGNGSSTIPAFDSGFPVGFALWRSPASQGNWNVGARLMGNHVLSANLTAAEQDESDGQTEFDSNLGFGAGGGLQPSSVQAWMWKRGQGFDVVAYEGTQSVQNINHSMNKAPEMMWMKNRDSSVYNWSVYHSGLGDNRFKLYLNDDHDYSNDQAAWNNTAPTSTVFTLGIDATANHNGSSYIALLFASTDVSKVGSYSGSNSSQTITTGFQPRFIIIKRTDTQQDWVVLDTTRGWASGDDPRLEFNNNSAQNNNTDFGAPTSTGFTLTSTVKTNVSGGSFVYYAHA